MIITITSTLKIQVDSDQYTLIKVSSEKNKKGEFAEQSIGYFSTLSSVLKKVVQTELASKDKTISLEHYIQLHSKKLRKFTQLVNQNIT